MSSSASTTIWPLTMCSPPAKRSIADTSALRQHGLVTVEPAQLVLDLRRHRHGGHPATASRPARRPRPDPPVSGSRPGAPSRQRISMRPVRRGEAQRVVAPASVASGDTGATTSCAPSDAAHRRRELALRRRRRRGSASTTSSRRSGAWRGEHLEVVARRRSPRSPRAAAPRLSVTHAPGRGLRAGRRRSSGTSRCGSTRVNHEPGPEHDPVGARERPRRPRAQAGGSAGSSRTADDPAGRRRDRDLAADGASRASGLGRVDARAPRPRCRAARRPSAAPGRGRRAAGRPSRGRRPGRRAAPTARRSAGCRPRGRRSVARRRRTGAAARRARCWPHSLVAAQRGQRHPQVARRQHAELAPQPAATSRRRRRR